MHWLSTTIPYVAFILGLLAVGIALYAMNYCYKCAAYVAENNVTDKTVRDLTALQAEMTDVTDLIASLGAQHKKLRSRITMRERNERGKVNGGDAEPDPRVDEAAWRRYWHRKLNIGGIPDGN